MRYILTHIISTISFPATRVGRNKKFFSPIPWSVSPFTSFSSSNFSQFSFYVPLSLSLELTLSKDNSLIFRINTLNLKIHALFHPLSVILPQHMNIVNYYTSVLALLSCLSPSPPSSRSVCFSLYLCLSLSRPCSLIPYLVTYQSISHHTSS